MKCKNCGINEAVKYSRYSKGEFCSVKCTKSFSTKNESKQKKKIACTRCNKIVSINKRGRTENFTCKECILLGWNKRCKWCGQDKPLCKKTRPDICRKHQTFNGLHKYFGLNLSKVGTTGIYEEYERIKTLVHNKIWVDNKSMVEISEEVSHDNIRNFSKILKSLGIRSRILSESNKNALLTGRANPVSSNLCRKGWHTDWSGNSHYYRSSYERDHYKILDEERVEYKTEILRILYWDSQRNEERVAIPDIYLPSKKLIIEIKSDYTYDKINMTDKLKSYRNHGYDFRLILEHKEYLTPP